MTSAGTELAGPCGSAALDDALAAAYGYLWDRSPWYRARFVAAGLDRGTVRGAADLARTPVTDKQDLCAAGRAAWCVGPAEVADWTTTSGTTGAPLQMPLTAADVDRLARAEELSLACTGLGPGDTVLLAVTLDRCFMAGLAYYGGLHRLGAGVARCGSASEALLLQTLQQTHARAIIGVPSLLQRVARYAATLGVNLRAAGVRKLICIGEPIRGADGELTPLAQRLSAAFDAHVYATFGATELASSLCECDAGAGGHAQAALHHVEILDDQDRPLPDGVVGHMVVTTLGVAGLPVWRYRLGDLAALRHGPCACGRAGGRLGPIVARTRQLLKICGTSLSPTMVEHVLGGFEEVDDYLMIATSPAPLCDELEVLVRWRDGSHDRRLPLLDEAIRGALKVRVPVRAVAQEELDRHRGPGPHRKRRVWIDQR